MSAWLEKARHAAAERHDRTCVDGPSCGDRDWRIERSSLHQQVMVEASRLADELAQANAWLRMGGAR